MNLKNKIKQDLESKLDINLSFDMSKLEVNEKRVINPRRIIKYTSLALAASLLIAFMVPIISMLDVDTTYNEVKRRYSLNEVEILNNTKVTHHQSLKIINLSNFASPILPPASLLPYYFEANPTHSIVSLNGSVPFSKTYGSYKNMTQYSIH